MTPQIVFVFAVLAAAALGFSINAWRASTFAVRSNDRVVRQLDDVKLTTHREVEQLKLHVSLLVKQEAEEKVA